MLINILLGDLCEWRNVTGIFFLNRSFAVLRYFKDSFVIHYKFFESGIGVTWVVIEWANSNKAACGKSLCLLIKFYPRNNVNKYFIVPEENFRFLFWKMFGKINDDTRFSNKFTTIHNIYSCKTLIKACIYSSFLIFA